MLVFIVPCCPKGLLSGIYAFLWIIQITLSIFVNLDIVRARYWLVGCCASLSRCKPVHLFVFDYFMFPHATLQH